MLIKVNSLICKTKINFKIKRKIKITFVLILSIFFYQGKSNKKTNQKNGLDSPLDWPSSHACLTVLINIYSEILILFKWKKSLTDN